MPVPSTPATQSIYRNEPPTADHSDFLARGRPAMHSYRGNPSYDKIKDRVSLAGPWFKEGNLGLAVPDYVTIDCIEQLNASKSFFASGGHSVSRGAGFTSRG